MNTPIKNPLLERARLPGEVHRLPSRGLFYHDGELDPSVKDGELQVFPMTTHDEIVMRSPDLLFNGTAVTETIKRCVPQVLRPEKMLAKDIDFLMVVLRKTSYGSDFEIGYKHLCENAKEHSYMLSIDNIIKATKSVDPTTLGSAFNITLPNEQVVRIEPLRYEATTRLMQMTQKELSVDERTALSISIMLDLIASVDNITDKKMISEWLETIPVGWSAAINKAMDEAQTNWGPDFSVKLTCKDCGELVEITAPLNPLTFFI